jgi:hypothetical protein
VRNVKLCGTGNKTRKQKMMLKRGRKWQKHFIVYNAWNYLVKGKCKKDTRAYAGLMTTLLNGTKKEDIKLTT